MTARHLVALTALAGLSGLAPAAVAQHVYRTDDGVPDGLITTGDPELLLLNYYTVEPPHDTITSLVVGIPAAEFVSAEALIWDDPDDDGDPSNGELISSTPLPVRWGSFELMGVDIAPVQVSGGFAVGVLVRTVEAPRMYMDRSAPTGAAWIMSGAGLDPADLGAVRAPGMPVDWFIRAVAGEVVCAADCDGSGDLDFFDFLCFQGLFASGDPEADCDGSGALDFFDFLCFQAEFAAGCP